MNRLNDLSAIEARLLELSHTTDVKITAPALAYFAPCSIENAQIVLDDLAAKDQLQMEVQDDGSIVYEMLGRQKVPENLRPLRREVGLMPAAPPRALMRARHSNPLVAALLSLWIPGAGHLYAGRVVAAVLWFLVVGAGYALILPGLILHMFAIVSAAATSARKNVELMLAGPSRQHLLAA